MAHFAKLDENDTVLRVNVVNNNVILNGDGVEQEQLGINFLTELHGAGNYKQTSYNHNFRKQYAGIGFTYNSVKDIFIDIQPFPSWSLNENDDWQAPVAYPDDGKIYYWNEASTSWEEET
tara:strand:- start:104 stop:463 length:360 start_codon:yes stop_codon:yes gene_type:complete